MDPDENLAQQKTIAARLTRISGDSDGKLPHGFDADVVRLCELVTALDEWISKGGFLPKAWRRE